MTCLQSPTCVDQCIANEFTAMVVNCISWESGWLHPMTKILHTQLRVCMCSIHLFREIRFVANELNAFPFTEANSTILIQIIKGQCF